jgi:hypothetical protein
MCHSYVTELAHHDRHRAQTQEAEAEPEADRRTVAPADD